MKFSDRLRKLIDSKGVTAYVVASETGVSEATMSRLLNNSTSKPNIKNVKLLAKYFAVNSDWLLTGEGEMIRNDTVQDGDQWRALVESQQRTIENLTVIIKNLTDK